MWFRPLICRGNSITCMMPMHHSHTACQLLQVDQLTRKVTAKVEQC